MILNDLLSKCRNNYLCIKIKLADCSVTTYYDINDIPKNFLDKEVISYFISNNIHCLIIRVNV